MTEIHIQTTVECCGAMHSTPFCPLCGTDLASEVPLVGLLKHVNKQATIARKTADGFRQRSAQNADQSEFRVARATRRCSRLDAMAVKWEAWRAELSEVVNPVKEGESDV